MNRTRLLFIGLVALALGGLLSSIVYKTLQARTSHPQAAGVDVVVAAESLAVGSRIEDRQIRLVRFPAESLPEGVFRSKTRVVGRGVVLPIVKGELILSDKIAGENAGSGLPALIPPGMRAVSVRVNEVVSVAGFVVPGTRVDVLVTGSPGNAGDNQTTTVLENIAVLAAGQKLERNSAGAPQTVPVITLLVSPEDAQKLTLASQEGRIQLSLRNPLDTNQQKLPPSRNSGLYGAPAPAVVKASTRPKIARPSKPAVLPPSPYKIEVIRGQEKKEIQFEQ